ncbi:hypothetical protein EW145_g1985 [Phellinidium pouzarii]|uniref:DNA endonuclease activator Ctp1 C-terminal domain-containing protein n=1 Tax=Phellinidium pouzarii TaxID=167371 RepID=A0A4S4LCY9_9AGAM|nr:hypothetical protein EW145_g1985 [Phellinidium pouzarii]
MPSKDANLPLSLAEAICPGMDIHEPWRFTKRSASWSETPSPIARKAKEHHSDLRDAFESFTSNSAQKQRNVTLKRNSLTKRESPRTSPERKDRYPGGAFGDAINTHFKIDTSRNDGLPFQFDEIVRGRDRRRRLEAGDCDCCKNYYDHVEPLPTPLLPPAWKSPARTRIVSDLPCRNVEQHKKRISRHRHQWAPPTTPPDYWNIGFPTTQEAADINKRAEDIHDDKRRRIESEANSGTGRFIRRNDYR